MLRALYDARAWSYALRFMRWMDPPAVSSVEVILHLQILLENHLPSHAFNLQRECSSDSLRRTLLGQIFEFFAHRSLYLLPFLPASSNQDHWDRPRDGD